MSRHHYDHIRANENFHSLVRQKTRLSWTLTAIILIAYFGFILTIAFYPEILGRPISDGSVITWGLPVGIGIILLTFIITGIYVYRANTLFDSLMGDVVDASNVHVNSMQDDRPGSDGEAS